MTFKYNITIYFFIFIVFLLSYFHSGYILNTNDFLIHEFAHQINQGKDLYIDIDYLVAPLSFYLLSIIQKLPFFDGYTYRIIIGLLSVLNSFIVLFFFKSILKNKNHILIFFFFSIFSYGLLIPSFWYGNLSVFCICALVLNLRFEEKLKILSPIISGLLIFSAILFKQNLGLVCLVSYLFVSVIFFDKKVFFFRIFGLFVGVLTFLLIFSNVTGLNILDYLKVIYKYNFELLQYSNRSTNLETFYVAIIKNNISYSDFNVFFFKLHFISAILIFLFLKKTRLIFESFFFFSILLISLFYFNKHIGSSFAILGNIFLYFILLFFYFIYKFKTQFTKFNKNNAGSCLVIIFASISGAIVKGPWGFNEVFCLIFLCCGIFMYFNEEKNSEFFIQKFIIIISICLFSFNFINFKSNVDLIKKNDFEELNFTQMKGFFFIKGRFDGFENLISYLKFNQIKNYVLFPNEDPIYYLNKKTNPTRIINASKNVYPFNIKYLINDIEQNNIEYVILKTKHVQNEGNGYYKNSEKKIFYQYLFNNYTLDKVIKNYKIFKPIKARTSNK